MHTTRHGTSRCLLLLFLSVVMAAMALPIRSSAQTDGSRPPKARLHREGTISTDTPRMDVLPDSIAHVDTATMAADSMERIILPDSVVNAPLTPPEMSRQWLPNPTKATWLGMLFPGAGQIYNRKYWKLPIFYGGFVACTYALTWNSRMYKDYSQAYIDIMDSNPRTNSYEDFLPPSYDTSNPAVVNQLKSTFKNKKDYYRKYRDLSIFAFVGVYILSVIDAYVDAELSNFDISPDLSMGIAPTVINDRNAKGNAYGLQYKINF